MNGTTFQVINPLAETVRQAEQIIADLDGASDELQTCIADERTWFSRMKEAESTYESLEIEITSEAIIAAQIKEGPLANIATTSKAYDIALLRVKVDARNGALAQQWRSYNQIKRSYEAAQIDLSRAETRFVALRKIAELKTQILRASAI